MFDWGIVAQRDKTLVEWMYEAAVAFDFVGSIGCSDGRSVWVDDVSVKWRKIAGY